MGDEGAINDATVRVNVWGCDAYCHVPKEQRSGLEPKAEPCIYLGHNDAQNAAYVLPLSTRKDAGRL